MEWFFWQYAKGTNFYERNKSGKLLRLVIKIDKLGLQWKIFERKLNGEFCRTKEKSNLLIDKRR